MTEQASYQVLLYYKYVHIENPQAFAADHLEFCKAVGLRGRILVAHEGINGTVSGTITQTEQYMMHLRANPLFRDIEFKIEPTEGHVFKRLSVRPRREIVHLGLEEDINPNELTGKYLEPKEFYEWMQRDDVIVLDARNDYEYDIGHFEGAIRPNVRTFRELPRWIRENLADQKDKTVLTYCTGGIRCEKLSGFLLREGFREVGQLHGGIIRYGQDPEMQGKGFVGKCYVFDERIRVPVNRHEDVVVGRCHHCGKPEDRYINCAYPPCHWQHICCSECEAKHEGFCSDTCREQALQTQR
ncbi:UPF0176 protein [Alicyclobacillus contaminans]|uniref:oxygen-dependent tRNA uridine(34) hydroxylase TrhO n=1 Tax=Alicyclobacillus contaminans TaxID=392016 RepID=UPI00041078B2|nr:rhodanese-related sulfurtransferase [Alicyclobacillus contaminans]GMA49729.1 UPF0176 protein [Alicyclobacillus contaminans]